MTVEYIEDEDGEKVFRVTVDPVPSDVMFIASVDSIESWELDMTPVGFEPYLKCLIKWDSCSHITFENQLHFCGVQDFKLHVLLMRELYTMAFRYMGREPQSDEIWETSEPKKDKREKTNTELKTEPQDR